MLFSPQLILAESEIPIKLIIGAVFFVIWAISQVITAATKPKDKHNPQGEVLRTPEIPPAPSAPPPRQKQRPQPQQRRQQQVRQQPQPKRPPPLKPVRQPAEMVELSPAVSNIVESVVKVASPITSRPKPVKSSDGPTSHQRLQAILRPQNLRKDYILTEILRPPLCMRSDD